MLVNLGDVVPLAHHAREIRGRHFAAHGSLHDVADALQVLSVIARLLGQERRVRRHPVQDAKRGKGFDVLDAAGIDEEFHGPTSFLSKLNHQVGPQSQHELRPLYVDSILLYLAMPCTSGDGALTFPALSTALTTYVYCTPGATASFNIACSMGDGVICCGATPCVPRNTR